ncbi:MAG: pseudouridine synthase [Desulfomonilaceae bacterium]
MALEKLQLILRDAGVASRRGAEELIRQGRVTINGERVYEPFVKADTSRDHIKVDGRLVVCADSEKHYYIFNKPRYVVSTMSDPQGRPCLGDIIKNMKKNVFSVGRLDFDAEGLMLLTNDGLVAQRLSHPSFRIPRVYLVKIKGAPHDQTLSLIRRGLGLGGGERLGNVRWQVVRKQGTSTWMRIVLFEGKKNEIKRIFFRIGHPARKIRRIGFGPLVLGDLPVGAWRELTEREKQRLLAELNCVTETPPRAPRSVEQKTRRK